MPIEFDVHITEKLLKRVALRQLLKGWPFILTALGLIGAGLVFDSRSKQWSAFSIVGMTAAGFMMLVFLACHIRQRRTIAYWQRMLGDAPVHYRLTEDTLHTQSNLGVSEMKWGVFRELVEYKDCLLLGIARGSHLTLPRADAPADALDFIRRKFQELKLPVKCA